MILGFFWTEALSSIKNNPSFVYYKRAVENFTRLFDKINIFSYDTTGKSPVPFLNNDTEVHFDTKACRKSLKYAFLRYPFVFKKQIREAHCLYFYYGYNALAGIICKLLYRKKYMIRSTWPSSYLIKFKGNPYRTLRESLVEFLLFNFADVVTVGTEEIGKKVKKILFNKNKIKLATNYADTELFSPKTAYAIKDKIRIIFVGRLVERKNIMLLIEAIKPIKAAELTIVGDGILRQKIEKVTDENNLVVHLLGNIENTQLPNLLQRNDIFVLPSKAEGTPKALLEAMSCAMPCIGTNVFGIASLLRDGRGLLCEQNPDDLREKILLLVHDEKLRQTLGKNARKYIEQNHTKQIALQQELDALRLLADMATKNKRNHLNSLERILAFLRT